MPEIIVSPIIIFSSSNLTGLIPNFIFDFLPDSLSKFLFLKIMIEIPIKHNLTIRCDIDMKIEKVCQE